MKKLAIAMIALVATIGCAHAKATHGVEIIKKVTEPMDFETCIEVIGDSEDVMTLEGFESSGFQQDGDYATIAFTQDDIRIEMTCVGGNYLYYKFKLTPIQ